MVELFPIGIETQELNSRELAFLVSRGDALETTHFDFQVWQQQLKVEISTWKMTPI